MICDYIEIGCSDFDTEIQKADDNTIGLSIEPLKIYLDKLPDKQNCIKVNVAISNYNGECKINYIPPEKIVKYRLPTWVKGCNSIDKHTLHDLLLKDSKINKFNISPDDLYTTQHCKVKTLFTIIKEHNVQQIKYLKIDTEGHDLIILNKFFDDIKDFPNLYPNKIQFEFWKHLDNTKEQHNKFIKDIEKYNYKLISWKSDIILEKII